MKLSNNKCNSWQDCNRRQYWEYEFCGGGIQPRGYEESLADGTAIHAGLEAIYSGKDEKQMRLAIRDSYLSEVGDLEQYAREKVDRIHERIEWGGNLLSAYRMRQVPLDDFVVLQVETEFNVVLGEICHACGEPYALEAEMETCPHCGAEVFLFEGRADLVVSREGLVRVVDHKTAKSVGSDYFARYSHSMQMLGYCYGIGKASGARVRGYGVNVIKKLKTIDPPRIKCKACKGKGCGECFLSGRVGKPGPELFVRKWVTIGSEDLDRFVLNRLSVARDIASEKQRFASEPEAAYPMNEGACHRFTSRPCPFIPLCWGGDPVKWYEPSDARLSAYKPKEKT